jgi:alkanesulfonate monooxygenase SsuD/methylene tetrahydromethanopterin reductase-like flavin-dependent oxidoreductase (luciferase family)
MEIGIGLPSAVPTVDRDSLLEWARRANAADFSSLAVIDRVVYPSYDPLIALAAAAAVTDRIGLVTSIVIAPLRSTAILAKQLASIDHFSGGRLSVGVGLGGREDDYTVSGLSTSGRGRRLDEQLDELRRIWNGDVRGSSGRPIGPAPTRAGGPPLLVGGFGDAAIARVARSADGWISGGLPPDAFAATASKVREAWSEAGRLGEPRVLANAYFALGAGARETAAAYIADYYAWLGDGAVQGITAGVATDEASVRGTIDAFREAGCDELLFFPCATDPEQVTLLEQASGST